MPDVQSERRIEAGRIVRGKEDALNDLDENAIEAALQAAENWPGSSVLALTMGPLSAQPALRRALQMGVDEAIQITDPALEGSDVLATAQVLAAAIQKIDRQGTLEAENSVALGAVAQGNQGSFVPQEVSLVLTGASTLDGMTSMVPGVIAQLLGWPNLSDCSALDFRPDQVEATILLPNNALKFQASYPLVLAVNDEANRPRHPNFKNMLAAKKKPLTIWSLKDLGLESDLIGSEHSGSKLLEAKLKEVKTAVGQIVTDSGQGGKELAQFLKQHGYGVES